MQKAIIEIEQWCKTWSMNISTQKSAATVFTNRPPKEVKLTINDNLVPQYMENKYLGIWFDVRLTWKRYIKIRKEKCS